MNWDAGRLSGPDGEDWRVPVSELEARQVRLSEALSEAGHESVLIDDPVELYWLTGGRQSSILLVGAENSSIETVHWVRRSLDRAKFEAGGDDAPHQIFAQPRMSGLEDALREAGCTKAPGMLAGKVPSSRWGFLSGRLSGLKGNSPDCTGIMFSLRETKSEWEIEMLAESGRINQMMFESIRDTGGAGKTEI